MSQRSLEEFGTYRKAGELFALVVSDMRLIQKDPLCFKLVSQQIIGILTSTIERLRAEPGPGQARGVREEVAGYGQ